MGWIDSLLRASVLEFEAPFLWYTLLQEQVTSGQILLLCGDWGSDTRYCPGCCFVMSNQQLISLFLTQESYLGSSVIICT